VPELEHDLIAERTGTLPSGRASQSPRIVARSGDHARHIVGTLGVTRRPQIAGGTDQLKSVERVPGTGVILKRRP